MSSRGNSYYAEGLEVVIKTTRWQSDMQMKVRWDLVETGLGALLGLLGRWKKSRGGSTMAMMGIRLRTTCMPLRPRERGRSRMNLKVHIIMIRTVSWRVYVGKLKSWS